ncbi:MAG: peptidoglycan DD-metalloendopeptidase family protein [Pseudomonadaceae bacterium]|nr:peptidoglycan DD-metalloendopeptidase family protein [Pseudomonadaceae bacterium]
MTRSIAGIRTQLANTQKSLDELATQQGKLELQRKGQAEQIAKHLRAASRLTGQDFFKLLLNMESPERFERMMRYHQRFSEARLANLAAYKDTLAELASNAEATTAQQAQLSAQQTSLTQRSEVLAGSRAQRQTLLDELLAEAETQEARRQRLIADQQRLTALIDEIKRRSNRLDGAEFVANKGSLPWPLTGQLVHSFGKPRSGGKLVWHGMQISAKEGAPVRAVHRGRVVFADWLRGFGLLTIVDHGDEYMTLYAHLDSLLKSKDDWVESGEAIAAAGRSGGQPQAGLYFEVRHHGEPENPAPWLSKTR